MFRCSKGTLVAAVVLGFCARGVLPMTITGPSSAQSNGPITFTWTSVSTDPTIFEIDIDEALNSLNSSDLYVIQQNIDTASGSTTFTPDPVLSVGTHRIAFSSNDGFQILAEGSIEILAASSSSGPSSTGAPSSSSAPASSPPVSSSSSPPSSSSPIPTKSSISQSSSSQTATSGPQNGTPKHHSNAGAIAGGVVGGIVVILLALLGWWYFRRRGAAAAAAQEPPGEITQFMVAPVSSALTGAPAVHNRSDNHEFRPWEDNATTVASSTTPAVSSSGTPAPSVSTRGTAGVTDRKQPVIMRWDPPGVAATQPAPGPSREQLLEEVQRLREHIEVISPPAYPGE